MHVCVAPGRERAVCVRLHSYLSIHRVCLWMYLHVDKVAIACGIPHVCVLRWCVDAGTAVSPRSREAGGVWGGWGVTNIPVAHYQQQHKHGLAVAQLLEGVFICVCV